MDPWTAVPPDRGCWGGVGCPRRGRRAVPGAGAAFGSSLAAPADVRHFVSRPDLRPPKLTVLRAGKTGAGELFIAPSSGPGQRGVLILDNSGDVVWFHPTTPNTAMNFRTGRLQRQARADLVGGQGRPRARAGDARDPRRVLPGGRAAAGRRRTAVRPARVPDHAAEHRARHELRGAADRPLARRRAGERAGRSAASSRSSRSRAGACSSSGAASTTWRSRRRTRPTPGIRSTTSTSTRSTSTTDGNLLVSARNTWAVYKVSRKTGEVLWRLGGKRSDFEMGKGTVFAWQHDARHHGDGADQHLRRRRARRRSSRSRACSLIQLDAEARPGDARARVHAPSGPARRQVHGQRAGARQRQRRRRLGQRAVRDRVRARRLDRASTLKLPRGGQNYRAFRFPWVGRPSTRPALVYRSARDGRKRLRQLERRDRGRRLAAARRPDAPRRSTSGAKRAESRGSRRRSPRRRGCASPLWSRSTGTAASSVGRRRFASDVSIDAMRGRRRRDRRACGRARVAGRGREVVVLERAGVGAGASGVQPGGVRQQWGTRVACRLARRVGRVLAGRRRAARLSRPAALPPRRLPLRRARATATLDAARRERRACRTRKASRRGSSRRPKPPSSCPGCASTRSRAPRGAPTTATSTGRSRWSRRSRTASTSQRRRRRSSEGRLARRGTRRGRRRRRRRRRHARAARAARDRPADRRRGSLPLLQRADRRAAARAARRRAGARVRGEAARRRPRARERPRRARRCRVGRAAVARDDPRRASSELLPLLEYVSFPLLVHGVYDVTPDHQPILGRVADGLFVACRVQRPRVHDRPGRRADHWPTRSSASATRSLDVLGARPLRRRPARARAAARLVGRRSRRARPRRARRPG